MTSKHLVDAQLVEILSELPDLTVSREKLSSARETAREMTKLALAEADPTVTVSEHFAPRLDGESNIRVVIYRPRGLVKPAPVVLQIHGGGFMFGSAEYGDPGNRAMANSVGCAVASVDYRLAPETPFPGGLEDCYAALVWLSDNASGLGFDPRRIAVRGESAGGNLAAALSILARDRGGPEIRCQLLIYPMLDDRTGTHAPHPYAGEFIWNDASNRFGWECWLDAPPGSASVPALAAPSRVHDLAGLPPTYIAAGALDLFIEENIEFARRLIRNGVPTELYIAPGAYHGFEALQPDAEVSRRFVMMAHTALKRAFK